MTVLLPALLVAAPPFLLALWGYWTSPTYRYQRAIHRQDHRDLARLRGHR